jgi:hypothetical protein
MPATSQFYLDKVYELNASDSKTFTVFGETDGEFAVTDVDVTLNVHVSDMRQLLQFEKNWVNDAQADAVDHDRPMVDQVNQTWPKMKLLLASQSGVNGRLASFDTSLSATGSNAANNWTDDASATIPTLQGVFQNELTFDFSANSDLAALGGLPHSAIKSVAATRSADSVAQTVDDILYEDGGNAAGNNPATGDAIAVQSLFEQMVAAGRILKSAETSADPGYALNSLQVDDTVKLYVKFACKRTVGYQIDSELSGAGAGAAVSSGIYIGGNLVALPSGPTESPAEYFTYGIILKAVADPS